MTMTGLIVGILLFSFWLFSTVWFACCLSLTNAMGRTQVKLPFGVLVGLYAIGLPIVISLIAYAIGLIIL